ncbi:MAG: hypothetical protein AB1551_04545 [Actinomycetota bacterium]
MFKKTLIRIALAVTAVLVFAAPAFANSSSYWFKMDYRYVNGSQNGIFHSMTGGNLTNSGQIWVYSKDGGAASPVPVTIEVWDTDGLDNIVCSLSVTPYAKIGQRKAYNKSCGHIDPDEYYIVAWKTVDDGNNVQASGTLRTT